MQQRPRPDEQAAGGSKGPGSGLPPVPSAADRFSEITPQSDQTPASFMQRAGAFGARGQADAPAGPGFGARPTGAPYTSAAAPGPGGPEAASYWARMKAKAQVQMAELGAAAAAQRGEAWRSAAGNVQAVREAAQEVVAERRSWGERSRRLWALLRALDSGPLAKWAARAMVCAWYINQVAEAVEVWAHLRNAPMRKRWVDDPEPRRPTFPVLMVALLLPCALLCAAGVAVPVTGGALLARSVWEDAALSGRQLLAVLTRGSRPTELLAKRLAIVGAALLVLAHSVKDRARLRTYAGVLLPDEPASEERSPPSRRKSAALLAGRLLLASLLLFAGWSQVSRVAARGGSLWAASATTPRQAAAAALDRAVEAAAAAQAGAAARAAEQAAKVAEVVEAAAGAAATAGLMAGGAAGAGAGLAGAGLGAAAAVGGLAAGAAGAGAAAAAMVAGAADAAAPGGAGAGGAAGGGGLAGVVRHHYGVPDAHDNVWQLVQLALALPLALGWQTALTCRALAAVLLLEAGTCWPWWAWYWPSWHAAAHARLHFFTNVAVAGGLVLLQCLGAGRFTVDRLVAGRKNQ
ncbi:hypothetical protein HYH02_008282 [Chlamydomonas schloesseri]|uniref:Uncharacterized protein n=1 Tax=Chlamydomonas schloesseri TaxID=2026947 RepID=A0A836B3M8_9CHLO|nr:hypothetical protein HYH02_008282 [Chlamydomonas schloesseri]|eukprot:KAG2446720.1 hypothetical protein HYH02_008282 [Chlamydomonas schloesseri]